MTNLTGEWWFQLFYSFTFRYRCFSDKYSPFTICPGCTTMYSLFSEKKIYVISRNPASSLIYCISTGLYLLNQWLNRLISIRVLFYILPLIFDFSRLLIVSVGVTMSQSLMHLWTMRFVLNSFYNYEHVQSFHTASSGKHANSCVSTSIEAALITIVNKKKQSVH